MNIGVLALQGAVREHLNMLDRIGAKGIVVKKVREIDQVDGLIIPGGESTTIGKLMVKYHFIDAVKKLFANGIPIYGTCAGLILLAKKITEGDQPLLGLMDIEVRRNAYGRQRESFEADLEIPVLGKSPFRAVFIRAPWIESAEKEVEILSCFDDRIVMARQGKLLVTAFHPELTDDPRIHRYFVDMIRLS